MKSTSGGVQLFVHLVLGVGTNQAYIALTRHCCTSAAQRHWFGAHLCASPIIYKAEIIVIKSVMSEHNSVFCSAEIEKNYFYICSFLYYLWKTLPCSVCLRRSQLVPSCIALCCMCPDAVSELLLWTQNCFLPISSALKTEKIDKH